LQPSALALRLRKPYGSFRRVRAASFGLRALTLP